MSFTEHTCVSVTCDTCSQAYTDDWLMHFDSRQEAVEAFKELRWNVNGDKIECAHCADKRACKETGHIYVDWDWRACLCGCADGASKNPSHAQPMETRHCDRCWHYEDRPVEDRPGGGS